MEQFLLPIDAVFQRLSRLQSHPERYRDIFLRLYEAIATSVFFLSSLLLALAMLATLVLLGRKWEQVSAIFGGFTFTAIQLPALYCRQLTTHQSGTPSSFLCLCRAPLLRVPGVPKSFN
jgi:Polysaccharide biosynthesis protein